MAYTSTTDNRGVAMAFSAARLTCFALLSAIEEDMRSRIEYACFGQPVEQVVGEARFSEARRRYTRDQGERDDDPNLSEILPYVDFQDAFGILNANKENLNAGERDFIRNSTPLFEKLTPIRNRVAHTRPLDYEDLPTVIDVANKLSRASEVDTPQLNSVLRKLEADPSFVLGLEIRFPNVDPEKSTRHNLPIPDFDETGFIGRQATVRSLLRRINGPYPVISLVGDGGIGKTSLALKAAYAVLDSENNPFDAIVWTTAKNSLLTVGEIRRIRGAVEDSLGLLEVAAHELGGAGATTDPMNEVLEYMQHFKVLLILDNLETVLDAHLREFLQELPNGSKVLITSRIGIGALEAPIRVEPLEKAEGANLLRALARARNVKSLIQASQETIVRLVERTGAHPLYLRWLVSAIQAGQRAEDALKSGLLLDYCMSNVYGYISDDARMVLRSMQALPGLHNQAALAYLNEMEVKELQACVLQLITTNFVNMRSTAAGNAMVTEYELSEFALDYLEKHHPVSEAERRWLHDRQSSLMEYGKRIQLNSSRDRYRESSLDIRGAGDFSVAAKLLDAISLAMREDYGQAISIVQDAQELAPDYHECYRIEGMIRTGMGNLVGANDSYTKTLELNSESSTAHYFYAQFLIHHYGDPVKGLGHLQAAARLDNSSQMLKVEIAKTHRRIGDEVSARDACEVLLATPDLSVEIRARVLEVYARSVVTSADKSFNAGDYGGCVELIEEFATVLTSGTDVDIDPIVRDRIHQSIRLVRSCLSRTRDGYLRGAATQINATLTRILGVDADAAISRLSGRVKSLNSDRGFGFIKVAETHESLFFMRPKCVP